MIPMWTMLHEIPSQADQEYPVHCHHHRRGTMVSADRLYGITMQEKGVSTLVSVNLIADDLDKYATG